MITCGVAIYRCPLDHHYSFAPCSIPALATHADVQDGWFRDLGTALDALLVIDPSWRSFSGTIYQALWARGDRPPSYDEHMMQLYGPPSPSSCWETRAARQRHRFGPLAWAGCWAGVWRWEGTWERTCRCTPPELVPADIRAGHVWRCDCGAEWKWEPDGH